MKTKSTIIPNYHETYINVRDNNNYSVTLKGEVYSHLTNKWLKPATTKDGYRYYCLAKNGVNYTMYQHELVYYSFMFFINKRKGYEINHLDRCRDNNILSNLEYITISANRYYKFKQL